MQSCMAGLPEMPTGDSLENWWVVQGQQPPAHTASLQHIAVRCNSLIMTDFTLKPHPTIPKPEGPLLVCVLDGFGEHAAQLRLHMLSRTVSTACSHSKRASALLGFSAPAG